MPGDLFTMLGTAARALDAQRYGLDVSGQNIANANTPGYARRTVQLGEVPPLDAWSAGGGVDVVAVHAARAPLLEARIRGEEPASAREGTIADHLAVVETALGQPGESLDASLTRFYNTYATLAQSPTSSSARQQVVTEGQSLSDSFHAIAAQLQSAQRTADGEIRDTAQQVNALARRIADLNSAIVDNGASQESLKDEQSNALHELAQLVDFDVIQRGDGTINVAIGNGRALVVGSNTYDLAAVSQAPSGFAKLTTDGADVTTDVTAEITGGRLGGLLQVRDTLVPGYTDRLDQLAASVAGDVNALTTGGYDGAGHAGGAFFTPPGAVAGAASRFSVNAAVVADHTLVVAGGTPSPGDNTVARSIGSLQDAPMTGSSSRPIDAWSQFTYAVAADARSAGAARDSHDEVAKQLKTLRDQISGVSVDEEAAQLMRFQRAYEANAKFFQIADQTLDLLMQLVRA